MANSLEFPQWVCEPTLIVDVHKAQSNIRRMANRAKDAGVTLRPHFKTHQAKQIGEWFRDQGVNAITVSSLPMAEYFAEAGWDDILIAFPVNIRLLDRLNALAEKVNLHIILDSEAAVAALATTELHPMQAWIEIDVGDGRSGIPHKDIDTVKAVAQSIESTAHLTLKGLIAHAGYSYRARSETEIMLVHIESTGRMQDTHEAMEKAGFASLDVSMGDTPTCSVSTEFPGVTEIRPGNFLFYDMMQVHIGSCNPDDIAVAMAAPVVATYPEQGKVVVHGGAVHLSKDHLTGKHSGNNFGAVVNLQKQGWSAPIENVRVSSLSQEHGVIHGPQEWVNTVQIGDVLGILPVHSCLAVDLMPGLYGLDGTYFPTLSKG